MFSSGMCTEVLQFDVSSTSGEGTITLASPPTQQSKNKTHIHKGKKNRRILRGGLPVSDFNLTKDHNCYSKENFRYTKPAPSMVVSVLVDPREGGDGDINEMMGGTKSLSRVFIVVLVDGATYVTYSCVLPRQKSLIS
ncbi:bZIP transcription factor 49 [Cardamine amara subsp. amara]|uniref:BZIP transcription factor 49 n=1 Tax=Cardamine amara subsp. amara TaxID=228776 RepID=A0ABD0ZA81_CARAN